MAGYNIQCDPGDLYSRRCYTVYCTDASGATCTCGTAGCTTHKEEIIAYTSGGDPISKKTGNGVPKWMAWIPNLTTLDDSANAYRPYGEAGIPFTPYGAVIGGQGPSQSPGSSAMGSASPLQTIEQTHPVLLGGAIAAITVGGYWAYKKFAKR